MRISNGHRGSLRRRRQFVSDFAWRAPKASRTANEARRAAPGACGAGDGACGAGDGACGVGDGACGVGDGACGERFGLAVSGLGLVARRTELVARRGKRAARGGGPGRSGRPRKNAWTAHRSCRPSAALPASASSDLHAIAAAASERRNSCASNCGWTRLDGDRRLQVLLDQRQDARDGGDC